MTLVPQCGTSHLLVAARCRALIYIVVGIGLDKNQFQEKNSRFNVSFNKEKKT